MQSLTSRLEGFTAASPSPPAAPAPPAAPPAAAAALLQPPPAPSSVPVSSAPVRLASPLRSFPVNPWNDKAEEAFNKLKQKFTTAPILTVPDPALQFVVEVDASNEGIGAVLSQRLPADNRIHPCAFLSRKLSAAERNYDVGNKELLAVKVALEEWRHWLEGAEQPFIVWTDHKNLEYLKSAKRKTQLSSSKVGTFL
ncbi:hypothetical protein L3Q82_002953 [Scortum barcoo]|uniref:Uncharacterized protein n=1 Tax=Scortum barcoo TaxID=214431 RepID=A0ACB8VR15_9TELE|nr:hypothetical protein L3Q82_002953 [Scortum barcoo]